MQTPRPFVHERAVTVEGTARRRRPSWTDTDPVLAGHPVLLRGDAYITITAPFFPDGDPLALRAEYLDPGDADLDGEGALRRSDLPLDVIFRGTLTFDQPSVDSLIGFIGDEGWLDRLRVELDGLVPQPQAEPVYDWIELIGVMFPDGYGSVAVTLRLPDGWESDRWASTLQAVGVEGRELLADRLRSALLLPLDRMLCRCGSRAPAAAVLPYFNLTYAGDTDHPAPGRATLDDELRRLVYPDSAMPLPSVSPWMDEYLYTGYAYHLVATWEPLPNLRKLTLLLLILNVSYARLARFAAAADSALCNRAHYTDVAWLARTERRLRSEYQALITPTFSFDHHALTVRDAVLRSWDVPKLQARADNLISMVRSAVEFRMAQDHARRIRRLNKLVLVLTAVSIIPVVETVLTIVRFLAR